MDLLEHYHLFSRACAKALNDAHVPPVDDGDIGCALLIVVHPGDPDKGSPVGGSLNFNRETKEWEAAAQLESPTPYHGD